MSIPPGEFQRLKVCRIIIGNAPTVGLSRDIVLNVDFGDTFNLWINSEYNWGVTVRI